MKQDENFEISSDARDYNNQNIDDFRNDQHHQDSVCLESDSDPFTDPYMHEDGGRAATEGYALWSSLMPLFAEMSRLEFFKSEIEAGNKKHKDFYVNFRQSLLEKFDNAVGEILDGSAGSE